MEGQYHFDGQRQDEDVIFVSKRHPWVLATAGFIFIIAIVILVVAILFLGLSTITAYLIFGAVLFFLIYSLYQRFLFNNYLYILTNQRIMIIEQSGLFGRKIVEADLEKIQNTTVEIKGVMGTFLNFGDIILRTAGNDPALILRTVENPYEIQQKINKYCRNIEKSGRNIIR